MIRTTFALLLATLATDAAASDVLVGPQGERIPGRLVEEKDGFIVFDSDSFGRLQIASSRAHLEGRPAARDAATVRLPNWTTDLSMKLGVDRGSLKTPEDDLDATLNLVRKSERGELHATFDYNYKRTDGVLKDDDLFASISYDRLLPSGRFVAGRVLGATELTSEGYDTTNTLSLAYGWRWWEGDDRYLRIGPAVGYLSLDRGENHFDGAAIGLYARAKGPAWRKISFSSELQFLDSLGEGRYANLAFQMRHPLGEHLYLALAWNYVWSDVDIESGITSEWRWVVGWNSRADGGH